MSTKRDEGAAAVGLVGGSEAAFLLIALLCSRHQRHLEALAGGLAGQRPHHVVGLEVDEVELHVLPGGEVGALVSWWNAEDGGEWRWQVEFYNQR